MAHNLFNELLMKDLVGEQRQPEGTEILLIEEIKKLRKKLDEIDKVSMIRLEAEACYK